MVLINYLCIALLLPCVEILALTSINSNGPDASSSDTALFSPGMWVAQGSVDCGAPLFFGPAQCNPPTITTTVVYWTYSYEVLYLKWLR